MSIGQEAVFFLQSDSANGFYSQIHFGLPLAKSSLSFESERKAVVRMLKVLADPQTALLSDKAGDRQFAASALIARYRILGQHSQPAALVNEPIPADESRLILQALSEMKWDDVVDPRSAIGLQSAFRHLQLTEKDGWTQPQAKANEDQNAVLNKAVSSWLKDNAGKYRIQRLVVKQAKPE